MMKKPFLIAGKDYKSLARGFGACIVSERITVLGERVGFMQRSPPYNNIDSGWWFTSGYESQEEMDDPGKHDVFDVNSLANYESDVIPYLTAPVYSAFERDLGSGLFLPAEYIPEEDDDSDAAPAG